MRKRNCNIHFRLSEQELCDLRSAAKKRGVNAQTFLIAAIYDRPIKDPPSEEYLQCCKSLREISESMTRIAAAAEEKQIPDSQKYWESVREIQSIAGKLIKEEQG